jgi:hypothetical protein
MILTFDMECSVTNDGKFINNEYSDVFLVTTIDPIPLEAFKLQVIMFMILSNSTFCIFFSTFLYCCQNKVE